MKGAMAYVTNAVAILIFVMLWEAVGYFNWVDPTLFPPPSRVIVALVQVTASGQLFIDMGASLARALAGFVLGSAVAVVLGLLCGRVRLFDAAITPIVQLLRPVPVIALVPLAIVWFGLGETSKVFMVFWAAFFPVWVGTYLGVSGVERNLIWAARNIGADRIQLWIQVILPAAAPTIIASLRTSISLSFIVLVAAEMAGSFTGIGYRINVYHLVFEVDRMLAYIVVLGVLGFATDRGFARLVNLAFPWYQLTISRD